MDESGRIFQMQQNELVALSAFFLALPLPPLLDSSDKPSEKNLEDGLKEAAASLAAKGWITSDASKRASVLPLLAEMLRDMAYGNQMVHIYHHRRGEEARQVAFYRNDRRVVRQELTIDGEHIISRDHQDMGRDMLTAFIQEASDGQEGVKVQFPLEAWHYLLSSHVLGIADQVQAQASTTPQADDESARARRQFSQDVLRAPLIMELTCVYDRLDTKSEKAAFVISENANWLAIPSHSVPAEGALWAIEVPRHKLLLALAGLYSDLHSEVPDQRRVK